ncbi:MAG: LysR family transcriptional regulator [Enterobacteriaceae bacterium]|jgi:DNA-binding transcriptional LysR family regulator|nr:LysR family transcriptional regulator [Enterobacteriaceae bacterium]
MIKIKPLYYFKVVVEQGSLSAASEVLHIAQPPLSKSLQQLEELWGVQLLTRTHRGMVPTEAGKFLYQRANDLLQMAKHLDDEMKGFGDGVNGMIRLGTVSMGMPRVISLMRTLRERYPSITFSLYQGDTQHLEDMLEKRKIDAALVHLPLTNSASQLIVLPLAKSCFKALCPSNSPLNDYAELTLKQLVDVPLVLLKRKSGFGVFEKVRQAFSRQGLEPQVIADASDVPIIKMMVENQLAIGLLPMLDGCDDDFSKIKTIPVPELDMVADELALVIHQQSEHNPTLVRVLDYFKGNKA